MRSIIVTLILAVATVSLPAFAQNPILPADGNWHEMQDGEVVQWSVIPAHRPQTRIDFVGVVLDNGKLSTYYLVQTACPNKKGVEVYTIQVGSRLGLGTDCDGNIVQRTSPVVLGEIKAPPAKAENEVSALIPVTW